MPMGGAYCQLVVGGKVLTLHPAGFYSVPEGVQAAPCWWTQKPEVYYHGFC